MTCGTLTPPSCSKQEFDSGSSQTSRVFIAGVHHGHLPTRPPPGIQADAAHTFAALLQRLF